MGIIKKLNYFSLVEKLLLFGSVSFIVISFLIFDRENYMNLIASLIGVTSLIFCAKGNPFGPVLMIIFSLFYGYISFTFSYFGEMITYLGMTLPMSVIAFISWFKNPYKENKSQVEIKELVKKEILTMCVLTLFVTVVFYYILDYFDTANLIPSTISVSTSFMAAYLTYLRSEYFALVYAANDLVLIILWSIASFTDASYISVLICFIVFLINDLYSFTNWKKMKSVQKMGN
ncbi:MAG: nicotinamide mononucleotide transporter [Ruminococcaceae bacterium]|nr:nicotinamide mononucleotide transporter [Oscillospiraceae bacterium]